jgi:putative sigma-54 modulation protein
MHIDIKATNIELTPEIKTYVEEKIGDLDKFLTEADQPIHARVEVGRTTFHHQKGDIYLAEVNLMLGGRTLRSKRETSDLHAAILEVRDELSREIKKAKQIGIAKKLRSLRVFKDLRNISWFKKD